MLEGNYVKKVHIIVEKVCNILDEKVMYASIDHSVSKMSDVISRFNLKL